MSTYEPTDGGTPQDPAKERFTPPIDPSLEDELDDKYREKKRLDILGRGNEHPEGVIDISDYPEGQEDEPTATPTTTDESAEPPAVTDTSGSEVTIMTPEERERLRKEDPEAYRRRAEEERDTDKDYWQ
ncbi:hypothetical protein IT414_04215 [bacterium]|nr:hypothetical protein [bacterium]